MKRERIPIRPGDLVRSPDRATARWHKVVRVGRRRNASRYIVVRRSRFWRAFGLPPMQRIEWAALRAVGYGIRRPQPAAVAIEISRQDAELVGLLKP